MLADRLDSSVVAYSSLAIAASKAVVVQQVNFNDEIERRAESTLQEPVDKVDVKGSGPGLGSGSGSGSSDGGETGFGNTASPAPDTSPPADPVRGGSVDVKA